jgi:hypothetical protein
MRPWLPLLCACVTGAVASWSCSGDGDRPSPTAITETSDASAPDGTAVDADAPESEVAEAAPPPPLVPTTTADFEVPGTQFDDVFASNHPASSVCAGCHGALASEDAPQETWRSSLMAVGGRDPLFFAQLATASQDAPGVAGFCLRCHVPNTVITGHLGAPPTTKLDDYDRDGVTCLACHGMVDPNGDPATNPSSDATILASLARRPKGVGNAQFVLDPTPTRRGPYADVTVQLHPLTYSPYNAKGELCGTCHEVGNPQVLKQPDGTYAYGALGARAEDDDPRAQFPLERTYSEWKLSSFAAGGVDLQGRFGGAGATVVSTCQDCHMPRLRAQGCMLANVRDDLARHEYAGAAVWSLQAIAAQDGDADGSLARGADLARSMLQRAATLEASVDSGALKVRVYNQSGHKLPTGHIEGRRVWVSVDLLDVGDKVVKRYGAYDPITMTLDEASTSVFEMQVGLSDAAAKITGLPPGVTTHMAIADVIVKDNRIPPRGFDPGAYAAVGAPVVGASYAAGQYWADLSFSLVPNATRARVRLLYQAAPREYVQALHDGNHTDDAGQKLLDLWNQTGRGTPIEMARLDVAIAP